MDGSTDANLMWGGPPQRRTSSAARFRRPANACRYNRARSAGDSAKQATNEPPIVFFLVLRLRAALVVIPPVVQQQRRIIIAQRPTPAARPRPRPGAGRARARRPGGTYERSTRDYTTARRAARARYTICYEYGGNY